MTSFFRLLRRLLSLLAIFYLGLVVTVGCGQRSILYHPSHNSVPSQSDGSGLVPWRKQGQIIGFSHEVANPKHIWLMLHGNSGQAQGRKYALKVISPGDSLFVVEYPGFGMRAGSPNFNSMNAAAEEAYGLLTEQFPKRPISVIGESMGSGPASFLAREPQKPDRIALVVPFDTLLSIASEKKPYLPVGLILLDRWDNIASLQGYPGRVDVFGAADDSIIPVQHAKNLAAHVANAKFHEFEGDHEDWSHSVNLE
jgi:pimeloyl-ACP methyl ester carboxylesterase